MGDSETSGSKNCSRESFDRCDCVFAGKRLISYILYFMANYVDTRYSMYLNAAGESSNAINFVLRLCFVVLLYLEFTRNREDGSEKICILE